MKLIFPYVKHKCNTKLISFSSLFASYKLGLQSKLSWSPITTNFKHCESLISNDSHGTLKYLNCGIISFGMTLLSEVKNSKEQVAIIWRNLMRKINCPSKCGVAGSEISLVFWLQSEQNRLCHSLNLVTMAFLQRVNEVAWNMKRLVPNIRTYVNSTSVNILCTKHYANYINIYIYNVLYMCLKGSYFYYLSIIWRIQ